MDKYKIIVPKGVKFIGRDWTSGERRYALEDYPFKHILNKIITGCGYTEYCLTNNQNLVLISPRKFLLENKLQQHVDDHNIYYAENKSEVSVDYERDISGNNKKYLNSFYKKESEELKEKRRIAIETMRNGIREHVWNCSLMRKPFKIMVTYDSFRHVKEVLKDIVSDYQVVVDEFQSIFMDARFKSDAELEFVSHLKDIEKVCYVSATPYLDEYMEMLDEFKDLPYYELDWKTEDPGRVTKPKLDICFTTKSLNYWVTKVIQNYLSGNFETRSVKDVNGKIWNVVSNEAVIFLNSVKGICKAITTNGLSPDQCNILCAKTEDNNKQVRRAFNEVIKRKADEAGIRKPKLIRGSVIGEIPKKGAPHKMFTFCTRTVYLGADFYSTCARTFIFSDSNIECLSVDISLDLEQILGRQRREDNLWKNTANLYVKTTRDGLKTTPQVFIEHVKRKEGKTYSLLGIYKNINKPEDKHNLAENYQKVAKAYYYRDDYVAVNRHTGPDLEPVFNNLMMVSEMRAFEIQQVDYADRFTVTSTIESNNLAGDVKEDIKTLANEFLTITNTEVRLKFIVDLEGKGLNQDELDHFFGYIPNKYKDYYDLLGFSGIRAHKYKEAEIKSEIEKMCSNSQIDDDVKEEIYKIFNVGGRYTKADIKTSLGLLYDRLGYQKVAKASDLSNYFDIKSIITKDKKNGFEILGKKS